MSILATDLRSDLTLSNPIALDKFASLPARKEPGQAVHAWCDLQALPAGALTRPRGTRIVNGNKQQRSARDPAAAPTASADRSFVVI
jgi:hypothetical protein